MEQELLEIALIHMKSAVGLLYLSKAKEPNNPYHDQLEKLIKEIMDIGEKMEAETNDSA